MKAPVSAFIEMLESLPNPNDVELNFTSKKIYCLDDNGVQILNRFIHFTFDKNTAKTGWDIKLAGQPLSPELQR